MKGEKARDLDLAREAIINLLVMDQWLTFPELLLAHKKWLLLAMILTICLSKSGDTIKKTLLGFRVSWTGQPQQPIIVGPIVCFHQTLSIFQTLLPHKSTTPHIHNHLKLHFQEAVRLPQFYLCNQKCWILLISKSVSSSDLVCPSSFRKWMMIRGSSKAMFLKDPLRIAQRKPKSKSSINTLTTWINSIKQCWTA